MALLLRQTNPAPIFAIGWKCVQNLSGGYLQPDNGYHKNISAGSSFAANDLKNSCQRQDSEPKEQFSNPCVWINQSVFACSLQQLGRCQCSDEEHVVLFMNVLMRILFQSFQAVIEGTEGVAGPIRRRVVVG